ncbi:MAG TPA: hypothetical protein P5320_09225 [Bacteroidales bacterium]|nr:hypothetical protein [Bacteroidales bacterium]HOK75010.1 hypothetical protein [Bacteroidales bacterium]HOM41110.1 hypothetical protein [Bacteroidales bacterium]HRR16895.1 hypothetical protein [Bacteroidales bacterium]HRU57315.1 hypothetical protein [Bacteroidales bacterium]
MKIVEQATRKLVDKVKSLYPLYNTPGFNVVESVKGLHCEMCAMPARSTLKHKYRCQKCNFQMEKEFPSGKLVEEPKYYEFCNP